MQAAQVTLISSGSDASYAIFGDVFLLPEHWAAQNILLDLMLEQGQGGVGYVLNHWVIYTSLCCVCGVIRMSTQHLRARAGRARAGAGAWPAACATPCPAAASCTAAPPAAAAHPPLPSPYALHRAETCHVPCLLAVAAEGPCMGEHSFLADVLVLWAIEAHCCSQRACIRQDVPHACVEVVCPRPGTVGVLQSGDAATEHEAMG